MVLRDDRCVWEGGGRVSAKTLWLTLLRNCSWVVLANLLLLCACARHHVRYREAERVQAGV